jgi:hypothetical protein
MCRGQSGDRPHQVVRADRLPEMGREAGGQRLPPVLCPRVRREGDGRHLAAIGRCELPQAPQQRIAVLVGHADVADEHVWPEPPEDQEGIRHGARRLHFAAGQCEHRGEQVASIRFVVHHQRADALQRAGSAACVVVDADDRYQGLAARRHDRPDG